MPGTAAQLDQRLAVPEPREMAEVPARSEMAGALARSLLAAVVRHHSDGNAYLSRSRGTWRAFRGLPSQVGAVRQFAGTVTGGHPAADDAILFASELATNAITHTASGREGGRFQVQVTVTGRHVAVVVTDQGGTSEPGTADAGPDGESGRGLEIVQGLAAAWAVYGDSGGRTFIAIAGPRTATDER